MKLGIINYGMGNIFSLKAALESITPDSDVIYTSNLNELASCDKLFLPGVGNFKLATEKLDELQLRDFILHEVLEKKKLLMGICLGMQLLFESSDEGEGKGLGLINSTVDRFTPNLSIKIPHMGFNEVTPHGASKLFKDINHLDFYFVHSFRVKKIPTIINSYCTSKYGEEFIASVEHDNIFGTQFHPEKSQVNGLKVLKNFLNILS